MAPFADPAVFANPTILAVLDRVFFQGVRARTTLVVDRLITMTKLAGEAKVVLRAQHDWQRFLAARPMYGAFTLIYWIWAPDGPRCQGPTWTQQTL